MKVAFFFILLIFVSRISLSQSYIQVCKPKKTDVEDLFREGRRYLFEGNFVRAQNYLLAAIKKDSNYCDAYYLLGYIYQKNYDIETALQFYYKSYSINSKNAPLLQNMAFVFYLNNQMNVSSKYYEELITLEPDNPEGYYGKAVLAHDLDSNEISLSYIEKAVPLFRKKHTFRSDVKFIYGSILVKMKRYTEAINYLEDAYSAYEDVPFMNYQLGIAYYHSHDNDEKKNRLKMAKKYLEKSKKLGIEVDQNILDDLSK